MRSVRPPPPPCSPASCSPAAAAGGRRLPPLSQPLLCGQCARCLWAAPAARGAATVAPRGLGRLGRQPAAAALSQLRCATTSQRLCPCGTHAAAHGVGGQWALGRVAVQLQGRHRAPLLLALPLQQLPLLLRQPCQPSQHRCPLQTRGRGAGSLGSGPPQPQTSQQQLLQQLLLLLQQWQRQRQQQQQLLPPWLPPLCCRLQLLAVRFSRAQWGGKTPTGRQFLPRLQPSPPQSLRHSSSRPTAPPHQGPSFCPLSAEPCCPACTSAPRMQQQSQPQQQQQQQQQQAACLRLRLRLHLLPPSPPATASSTTPPRAPPWRASCPERQPPPLAAPSLAPCSWPVGAGLPLAAAAAAGSAPAPPPLTCMPCLSA